MWDRSIVDAEECRRAVPAMEHSLEEWVVWAHRDREKWGDMVRRRVVTVEFFKVRYDRATGAGDFDDPAWIDRRAYAAVLALRIEIDPLKLWGRRTVVRIWHEEVANYQTWQACDALRAAGREDQARAGDEAFYRWLDRPDAAHWDQHGGPEPVFSASIVDDWEHAAAKPASPAVCGDR